MNLTDFVLTAPSYYDYIVGNESLVWCEAEGWCLHNYGRYLASIRNHSQQMDARTMCNGNACWIGATCQFGVHGDWVWSDNTTWNYTYWNSTGEPNSEDGGNDEDCVLLGAGGDGDIGIKVLGKLNKEESRYSGFAQFPLL